jgi:hypothetical protein
VSDGRGRADEAVLHDLRIVWRRSEREIWDEIPWWQLCRMAKGPHPDSWAFQVIKALVNSVRLA